MTFFEPNDDRPDGASPLPGFNFNLDDVPEGPFPDVIEGGADGGPLGGTPVVAPVEESKRSRREKKDKSAEPKADKPGRPAKKSAERRRVGGTYLGLHVTPSTVYAALVQETADGFTILRRFARQRSADHGVSSPDVSDGTPESLDDDSGVRFSQGGDLGAGDLFLDTEFGDLANLGEFDESSVGGHGKQALPIVFELKDLLDECATAGYDKPQTAFVVGHPAVECVELLVPDEKRKDDKAKKAEAKKDAEPAGDVKRDRLLTRLGEEYDQPFDKDRVGFVPMTPREGVRRYMAVVPTNEDAVPESLELLREQSGTRSVPFRAEDAEVSVLIGMARWAFPADPHENTAIVRVGSENTLVVLLQGGVLHHQEHMLSVTTLDGPDTICSRVLLQQDVQGIGTVHQVVVLSEEREDELVRGFSAFYPDARVEALRHGVREHGVIPPGGENTIQARVLPAVGAALRVALGHRKEAPFEDVNLLPKRLRRVRPKLEFGIAWHTLVAAVVLFCTVLFFVSLYFAQQGEIAEAEQRVAAYPAEVNMSPQALQAQIDSLNTVYMRITSTLATVDSLLIGSDRWSRSMARLARAGVSTGGTWVEQWNPQGQQVQMTGFATGRGQVVQFAERMNGTIDELSFADIRDFPVYRYSVTAPVPEEMPEVALYLREQADVPVFREEDPLGNVLNDGPDAGPSAY